MCLGFLTPFIRAHAVSEIQDCAIAVDATYYLQQFIDVPDLEPLLPALGGQTGIQGRLSADLDQWKAHGVTPFFVFDGQSMTGQDEVTVKRGIDVLEKSDYAWDIYFNGQANEAVVAFGRNSSMSRII
ncbi:hypothetical protein B0T17DRAFT_71778 [Bombardia bombarda]|uniref:XPG N-terminal domain-containing protein n=1 Tax=Bombardia bombarda TaxID=252184 RepID=A0AA40CEV3_9PEZI|nr:hypothetical protein B0T17DRAFT_71778 [Bombardia bombarda]